MTRGMLQSLNFKHLYYFWVIAREGSLARAAQLLNLAPQTLSSQLTALESSLDSLLFRRENRRLVLTDLGQTVYRYADDMFRIADELKTVLDTRPDERALGLTAGVAASIHKLIAYQLLEPALTLTRPVRLSCRSGRPSQLLQDLKAGQLDVVLTDREPDAGMDDHCYVHPLGQTSITLFATPDLAATLQTGFPHSLQGQAFLANAVKAPYVRQLMQWFDEQGIRLDIRAEIDDSALIKVFGHQGYGVFAAPTVIADEVCRQYQVAAVGEVAEVRDQLYAVSRSRRNSHPAVAAICGQSLAS